MNSFGIVDYEQGNQLLNALIKGLDNAKNKRCALLWLELLKKPRTKNCFPDDIQRCVQLTFISVVIVNMLVGPFKKNPRKFSDPLHYVVTNYSNYDIRILVQKESARIFFEENPDIQNDDFVAIVQYINNFGLTYTTTTKAIFDKKWKDSSIGICAFQIMRAMHPMPPGLPQNITK